MRDFGTIYEGLLESGLSVAEADLTTDSQRRLVPALVGDRVDVAAGDIYIHNQSGERKSTGSYFTKSFAVEHLLDHALEPAIDGHLERIDKLLNAGDKAGAAEAFFDFRCADIAMGSGHFLVAAVDRIEARLSTYLADHPIPGVLVEMSRLQVAAQKALGNQGHQIETATVLRRLIARRCVYGVDRNEIAVELARLSLWIHTFVPGLPLSFLNHNLARGDSLVGIGSAEEVVEVLEPRKARPAGQMSFVAQLISDWLDDAREPLLRLGRAADATRDELAAVYEAQEQARDAVAPVRDFFDLVCAMRRGEIGAIENLTVDAIVNHPDLDDARMSGDHFDALHFPVVFPEVFMRERPGFDCLLGNPPWEKLQVEEHSFYALHVPGLRGLSQDRAEQELARLRSTRPDLIELYETESARVVELREALAAGPYAGLTAGRPDLFKAFAWRFFQLVRDGGRVGIVLPRKALEASGTATWRKAMLADATFEDVTMLVNRGGWVFDEVHQQYTIGLISLLADRQAREDKVINIRGPFRDLAGFTAGAQAAPLMIPVAELLAWSDSGSLPMLRDENQQRVWLQIRGHPRLSSPAPGWTVRGLRELNASDDKEEFEFEPAEGRWPVYKGGSFDTWNPDTGEYFAWAEPDHIKPYLQARRRNQVRMTRSAFFGATEWAADKDTLPCLHPRICWRDTARATDTRTVRAALVPPNTILVHQAFWLFWREGNIPTQAYALGMLCSLPFDWYARQIVESRVTIEFMNAVPIPRPPADDKHRQAVARIAATLAATDRRFNSWAAEAGVSVQSHSASEQADLEAQLDAHAAHLYGLTRADLQLIFATFHEGWSYEPRMAATLVHYDRLA